MMMRRCVHLDLIPILFMADPLYALEHFHYLLIPNVVKSLDQILTVMVIIVVNEMVMD